MRYYRDTLGRFAKRPVFPTVVAGRLYDYRGSVVRAGRLCANGKRHVSFHKQLHGFVEDRELRFIDKSRVSEYLGNAATGN
jgi:hypothetical protein